MGVEPIATVIRSDSLRWYEHVMRKNYEDQVEKIMEIRVEGRRPRKTWLENVEAEMRFDREDVHDRERWRKML